jgi:hypothetical protein
MRVAELVARQAVLCVASAFPPCIAVSPKATLPTCPCGIHEVVSPSHDVGGNNETMSTEAAFAQAALPSCYSCALGKGRR